MSNGFVPKLSYKSEDKLICKWLAIYVIARKKCGNYRYEDRYSVINSYIDAILINQQAYLMELRISRDTDDKSELEALESCIAVMPLELWKRFKDIFFRNELRFEERVVRNLDKYAK